MAKRSVASINSQEYDELIAFVKELRQEHRVSQEELSKRLNQAQNYILKVEHKDRRLDVVEFILIAEALGVTPTNAFERLMSTIRPGRRPDHKG